MTVAGLASLLPLPVVFPIVGAVLAPLAARVSRRLAPLCGLAAMLGADITLLVLAPKVLGGRIISHYLGLWRPVAGHALGVGFAADPFGLLFALVAALIGTAILLYAGSELGGLGSRELGGLTCLIQLMIAALIGGGLTADLFNLFVWFEVAALASYGLTGFFLERPVALEAAFKLLVLTTIASFAIFIGIGLLYSGHGALNYGELHLALARHLQRPDRVALGLLIAGFATKAGLVPFHGWLADAHTAAPGPVSALFSGLMVSFGVVAIARLSTQVFTPQAGILGVLMIAGVASALLGAAMALAQDDLKRLLAYDTVSQIGVITVGFATGTAAGAAGATYHLINHALFKSLLFLCAGTIVHRTGIVELSRLGGLIRTRPFLTATFIIGVAAIAGVPPMNGYFSLDLIHAALRETHQWGVYAFLMTAQVITIAALGRAVWVGFLRRPSEEVREHQPLRAGMIVGLSGLAACCVVFGVLAGFVKSALAAPAAASLTHPEIYAAGVLSGFARLPAVLPGAGYLDPGELGLALASLAAGCGLFALYNRSREPAPLRLLRALHTGSVNDYASFAVAGALAVILAVNLA